MFFLVYRAAVVDCEVPFVELGDGSLLSVLDVDFPDGRAIRPCCTDSSDDDPCVIACRITFQSPSPVSFTAGVQFTDGKDKYELVIVSSFAALLSISVCLCLSVCLPLCLSLSVYLYVSVSVSLCLSVCLLLSMS